MKPITVKVVSEDQTFLCEVPIHPFGNDGKTLLVDDVENDMIAEGLDPLNKDDVKQFWRARGIEV